MFFQQVLLCALLFCHCIWFMNCKKENQAFIQQKFAVQCYLDLCRMSATVCDLRISLYIITYYFKFKKKPKKQTKTQALFLSKCNYTELLLQEISKTERYIPSPDSLPLFILSRLGPCNKYHWVTALFSDHDLLKKECNSLSACGSHVWLLDLDRFATTTLA